VKRFVAFASGLVFALGLGLAGMTRPQKVTAFLDVTGAWDASLALVMGAAVAVGLAGFAWVDRRRAPVFGGKLSVLPVPVIDARLVSGAAVFGLGWGVSGWCPGPAIMAVATLEPKALVFLAAMAAGMVLVRAYDRSRSLWGTQTAART
jgi:uncharacterized membrane protein YedE/YeeE